MPAKKSVGRPADSLRNDAFLKMCQTMEDNDECQYSFKELSDLMQRFLPDGEDPYSMKHMRTKLAANFGDRVAFIDVPGVNKIVCFRETTDRLIRSMWSSGRKQDKRDERASMVDTAAAILREEIRSVPYDLDTYSMDGSDITDQDRVPELLRRFVNILTGSRKESAIARRRRDSLCDLMISACRPHSFLSPILLSLGVYLHRHYESRQVIDILHSVGLCVSYDEVKRCEYSLMTAGEEEHPADSFVQFAFDNADVNIRTLDGHGTFHNMAGIMYHTPRPLQSVTRKVPRLKKLPEAGEIMGISEKLRGRMEVAPYHKPSHDGLAEITIRDVDIVNVMEGPPVAYAAFCVDMLWMSSFLLTDSPTPNWNGYFQECSSGPYEVSAVKVLPFINRNPSDPACIFTALQFAAKECKRIQQNICFVTFDQPLYAKAAEIVAADGPNGYLASVVVRLGGFHMLMSMMGAIGHIMEGSGLEELWATVYAKNSVSQMMNGHAYARGVRAHFLTQLALCLLLLRDSGKVCEERRDELQDMYSKLLHREVPLSEAAGSLAVTDLAKELHHLCSVAAERSRTAALWVQYIRLVELLRMYLRSERCGHWELHLICVRKMIPIFHAAAHLPYAKSARMYLQTMEDLPHRFAAEDLRTFCCDGYFTIRRSDRFWCGVSPDLGIEQGVMRPMKTIGGLVGGRGITESTLTNWVSAIPRCVSMCDSLELFCGVRSQSSEQHVEMRDSRQERDRQDLRKFSEWLNAHPPFSERPASELVSLSTGIIAEESINCYRAEEIGIKAMREINGKNFSKLKLKRKDKVTTFASMSRAIVVHNTRVEIRPEQLFNRIILVCVTENQKKEAFAHELAPQPPSIFEHGIMRKTPKAKLSEALQDRCPCESTCPPTSKYVLDGGNLLYTVTAWKRDSTYSDVCDLYCQYVVRHYGTACTVVFDGYQGPPSTKSAEQRRRTGLKSSLTLEVRANLPVTSTSAEFLANYKNKVQLIDLLSNRLRTAGITVLEAEGDADVLIVSTALSLSRRDRPVAVVGTDTDVLALLIARASNGHSVYMHMPAGPITPARVHNIAKLQKTLGKPLKDALLFCHAMTGCDTTSALFGKGKKSTLELLEKNSNVLSAIGVFNSQDATHEEISSAGEKFIIQLYQKKKQKANFEKLNDFRYFCYGQAVGQQALSRKFDISTLPPTSDAARLHSYRVYHQVQQWLGRTLPPTDWGWRRSGQWLEPVPMMAEPAPENLMHLLSCKCKDGCGPACGCRCSKLVCTPMCKHCQGIECFNCSREDGEKVEDGEAGTDIATTS